MGIEFVLLALLQLISPILSVSVIKGLLRKAAESVIRESVELGSGLKHVLGLVLSFLFFVAIRAGLIPIPDALKDISPVLLTLVSKGLYDLIHEGLKKLQDSLGEG